MVQKNSPLKLSVSHYPSGNTSVFLQSAEAARLRKSHMIFRAFHCPRAWLFWRIFQKIGKSWNSRWPVTIFLRPMHRWFSIKQFIPCFP